MPSSSSSCRQPLQPLKAAQERNSSVLSHRLTACAAIACSRMGPLMMTAGPDADALRYRMTASSTSSGSDCSQACSTSRLVLKFSG